MIVAGLMPPRYRHQLQTESKRSQELLGALRRYQAAEGAASSAYLSSLSIPSPAPAPRFTTGYGGVTHEPPPQRPASAPGSGGSRQGHTYTSACVN